MQGFARRLVLLLSMLAFIGAVPIALAVPPVLAGEPCPHDHDQIAGGHTHHRHHTPQKHQHRTNAASCLCCCVGAGVAVPALAHSGAISAVFAATAIVYAERIAALAGRSPRPDPAPPRSIALS